MENQEEKSRDFFWPSYVDLMTALFAIVLVLFILTYHNLNKEIEIKEKEAALLNKVKANLKLFQSDPTIFKLDTVYNRIQLAFNIKFRKGLQYYHIDQNDVEGFDTTKQKLNELGKKLKMIVDTFQSQKSQDTAMNHISYLVVISGSASKLPGNSEHDNYILSYQRALSLYKYWRDSLHIDFDAPKYHNIIELQIAGVGFGGVGRYNFPYRPDNLLEEEKNQRFIIHIAPKIGEK